MANPTDGIIVMLPDKTDPDPFACDEIATILATPPRMARVQELNLVKFMLWADPRVSEAIPFAREDVVDLDRGLAFFRRSCLEGRYPVTKTKRQPVIMSWYSQPERLVHSTH